MTPKETDPDLPLSVQESPMVAWVGGGLLHGWGTEWGSACMDLLKELDIIFITSTIVWSNNRE